MRAKSRLTLVEAILFGLLGAIMFALQVAMSPLPNIEPVSLLIMVYAAVFGLKALYPVYIYVALDIMLFGLGVWNIYYLYVWAVLAVISIMLKKMKNPVLWAILSGAFGLFFGIFCAITDVFIGGFGYAAARWVSGIPFDVAHCAGNFVIALLLFKPLRNTLEKLYERLKSRM